MLAILPKIAFLFRILTDFVYYRVKINEFLGIWRAFVHVKILGYFLHDAFIMFKNWGF